MRAEGVRGLGCRMHRIGWDGRIGKAATARSPAKDDLDGEEGVRCGFGRLDCRYAFGTVSSSLL